jgi:hypothetical protein
MREEDPGSIPEYDFEYNPTGDYYGMGGDGANRERGFFNPTFTRRAAQGGIMQLAEGGSIDPKDPAQGMTGASADAMRYLMGQSEMSPATMAQRQSMAQMDAARAQPAAMPEAQRMSMMDAIRDPASLMRAGVANPTAMFGFNRGSGFPAGGSESATAAPRKSGAPRFEFDPMTQQYTRLAQGGLASLNLEDGDFIVPADVTAFAGGGSTDAGMKVLAKKIGAKPIKGPGTGLSDDIPARINGKQPARVANGEMLVRKPGKEGAKKLYAMMDNIRKQATGSKKQIRPVNVDKALA